MLKNKAFLTVMFVYLLSQIAVQFVQNGMLLYAKYVLKLEVIYFVIYFILINFFNFFKLVLVSLFCYYSFDFICNHIAYLDDFVKEIQHQSLLFDWGDHH